jgi:hypothetical protein
VDLEPVRPTPTPTPTATPTPTPTPAAWLPGKTVEQATDTLGGLLRGVVELLIWVGIVGVPCLLPVIIVVVVVILIRRRRAKLAPVKANIGEQPKA